MVIGFGSIPVILVELRTARILSKVAYPIWSPEAVDVSRELGNFLEGERQTYAETPGDRHHLQYLRTTRC